MEPHVDFAHEFSVLSHVDCGFNAGDLSSQGKSAPMTGSDPSHQPWISLRCAVAGACGEACLQEPAQQERLLSTSQAAFLACCDFDVASEPWLRLERP